MSDLQLGALVEVRGQRWVVAEPPDAAGSTLVELQSLEDGRFGETLTVVWDVEPGARVLPARSLPAVDGRFDPPEQLAAFLDAVRWGAVTSADVSMLQAPFRSGVMVEDYQLEPVARALTAPRVNLLLADDVGLGKTIEAGLVAQELLLRQRARRVMVVCPAGLTAKWQQEMAEKFGIDFTIVNSEQCKALRLSHGSAANPFEVYPYLIVSLPWLRSPRAQRLLDEVLPAAGPAQQRRFDLLILDEAHHAAPAAPRQRYAVDSQQTKLIRRLVAHFEHRLFLSATPHNGYLESFTALLELIDNQRFARGMAVDELARREVVVRRLKTDVTDERGARLFMPRAVVDPLVVDYPDHEREAHQVLTRFTEVRQQRLKGRRRRVTDLITLLLKKRLFSSPEAFGKTVDVLRDTYAGGRGFAALSTEDGWAADFFAELDDVDDDELLEREETALRRAGSAGEPSAEELELLEMMGDWARRNTANPDAKAKSLIGYLKGVCLPDGKSWSNERVVVFTEYRDTQLWLERLLRQEGMSGERVGLLHGGLGPRERETLRQAFQTNPADPAAAIRVLLATDAASEGIDLHWHCHRLVNYDIPFNPNKLEQRIGRIDRYGQKNEPEVRHFVGAGWEKATDTFAADLEFLSRIARKVAQIEVDLGAVNAVLDAVHRRMLGERIDVDAALAAKDPQRRRGKVPSDPDVSGQARRLRDQIDKTIETLNLTPAAVQRVVRTALALARQEALAPAPEPGIFEVRPLTGPWSRAVASLPHPLRPDQIRPVTFDPGIAKRHREDVVYAHLGHPLVSMSTRLLRAAVTGTDIQLQRVTAVISDHHDLEGPLLGAYARFVIVGGDGVRLHEEVLHSGGWLREGTRGFARLENVGLLDAILSDALATGAAVPPHWHTRLAAAWPRARDGLIAALDSRAATRQDSLANLLGKRQAEEEQRIAANLDRFAASLREALGETNESGFEQLMLELRDPAEIRQAEADKAAWRVRLDRLREERAAELERIRRRYADPQMHLFPVAVVAVVPRREVVR